jgi:hypothetical protein
MLRTIAYIFLLIVTSALTAAAQTRGDLVVSRLEAFPDPAGRVIAKISVTVSNVCRGSHAAASFVLVTFKESDRSGSKAVYFVGSKLKALPGGESQTLNFEPVNSGKEIAVSNYVLAEVDPYRKVAETDELNNWRALNPAGAPAASQSCNGRSKR